MIQFRRGKTANWRKTKTVLAAGQPGYDKDKHKIKVGDGEKLWSELPYASGLSAEEVFNSEVKAKERYKADNEDKTIITYGSESPDKDTVGQVYLQCYDAEPEVDYVVEYGVNGIWTYRKWHSGLAECWGTYKLSTQVQESFESGLFFNNNAMQSIPYPFTFNRTPHESATLKSPGGIAWLAGNSTNTKSSSGKYTIISPDSLQDTATYHLTINVHGYWKD